MGSGCGIRITEGLSWGRAVTQRSGLGLVRGPGCQIAAHSNGIPEGEWSTLEVVSSLALEECKHSDDHAGRTLHRCFRWRILWLGLWHLVPSIFSKEGESSKLQSVGWVGRIAADKCPLLCAWGSLEIWGGAMEEIPWVPVVLEPEPKL